MGLGAWCTASCYRRLTAGMLGCSSLLPAAAGGHKYTVDHPGGYMELP